MDTKKLLKLANYLCKYAQTVVQNTDYEIAVSPVLGIDPRSGEIADNKKVVQPLFNKVAESAQDTTKVDVICMLGGPENSSVQVLLNGKPSNEITQYLQSMVLPALNVAQKNLPKKEPHKWAALNFTVQF
jgi:hypothetical protein